MMDDGNGLVEQRIDNEEIKKDKERAKLDQLRIDNPTAYQREMQKRSFASRQGSPGTQ